MYQRLFYLPFVTVASLSWASSPTLDHRPSPSALCCSTVPSHVRRSSPWALDWRRQLDICCRGNYALAWVSHWWREVPSGQTCSNITWGQRMPYNLAFKGERTFRQYAKRPSLLANPWMRFTSPGDSICSSSSTPTDCTSSINCEVIY